MTRILTDLQQFFKLFQLLFQNETVQIKGYKLFFNRFLEANLGRKLVKYSYPDSLFRNIQ
jgi:hypothetical protein